MLCLPQGFATWPGFFKIKDLADYKYPPYQEVSVGVSVGDTGQYLELGYKRDGVWEYTPIVFDVDLLKK